MNTNNPEDSLDNASALESSYSECCEDHKLFCPQYAHLFKTPGIKYSQNNRRKALLNAVKERRNASIDEKRNVSEIFNSIKPVVEEEEVEAMEVTQNQTKSYKTKKKQKYALKFMLSEYLREMPDDMELNWMFKMCPLGVRNMVVADNRSTKAYNKRGVLQAEFESLLPGGGPNNRASKFTILDCIYNPLSHVYYVLDIMAWNSYSLINCSTEFRFFFLRSKLEENPEISQKSKHNKYPFMEIAARPAQIPIIEDVLMMKIDYENHEALDGILFYHSEVDYRAGPTPLVGWLKPYMVPEILQIPIHESYLREKPANYTNLEDHIELYKKRSRKYRQRKVRDVEMMDDFVDSIEDVD